MNKRIVPQTDFDPNFPAVPLIHVVALRDENEKMRADLLRAERKLRDLDAAWLRQPHCNGMWYRAARANSNAQHGKPDPLAYRERHSL